MVTSRVRCIEKKKRLIVICFKIKQKQKQDNVFPSFLKVRRQNGINVLEYINLMILSLLKLFFIIFLFVFDLFYSFYHRSIMCSFVLLQNDLVPIFMRFILVRYIDKLSYKAIVLIEGSL